MSKLNSSTTNNFTTGIMVTLMGGLVFAIGFGVIPIDQSEINVPRWLIAVFGSMFLLAGLWAMLKQAVRPESTGASWMNFAFALLVMLAMSVICLWITFGAGDRMFTQRIGARIDPTFVPVNPTIGRIFFGLFGFLMSGVTVAVAIIQGRKLLRKEKE